MKQIPIFFTFDNNYVIPAAVAFYSLLNKAKKDIFYKMYILHHDITSENQTLLKNIIGKFESTELNFIDTENFMVDEFKENNFSASTQSNKKAFTSDAILRCFAAKFFPQFDKIIYSDVDVVFNDDISELYDIDLTDKYIAAVKNPFMKFSEHELSHLSPENYEKLKNTYFGGGIWVLNLAQIRKDNLEEKMIEIINDKTIIKRWNDQDIMNLACDNKVAYIPLNYIGFPYLLDIIQKDNWDSHYSRDELYDSIINPKIIHYAANKPWNAVTNLDTIWWQIYKYLELPKTSIIKDKR